MLSDGQQGDTITSQSLAPRYHSVAQSPREALALPTVSPPGPPPAGHVALTAALSSRLTDAGYIDSGAADCERVSNEAPFLPLDPLG